MKPHDYLHCHHHHHPPPLSTYTTTCPGCTPGHEAVGEGQAPGPRASDDEVQGRLPLHTTLRAHRLPAFQAVHRVHHRWRLLHGASHESGLSVVHTGCPFAGVLFVGAGVGGSGGDFCLLLLFCRWSKNAAFVLLLRSPFSFSLFLFPGAIYIG